MDSGSETARLFVELAGVDLKNIRALRTLPVASILEAQAKLEMELLKRTSSGRPPEMSIQPVIDGHVLTLLPLEALRQGHAAVIPILIGTTGEESKMMTAPVGRLELSDEVLAVAIGKHVRDNYRQARAARGEQVSNYDVYGAVDTDYMFRIPASLLPKPR